MENGGSGTDTTGTECGDNYSDKNRLCSHIDTETEVTVAEDWTYKAVNGHIVKANKFNFSATFTMPATRIWEQTPETDRGPWSSIVDGGNTLVARFYQMSDASLALGSTSLASVLIGARAPNSYGDYSRRVQNKVFLDAEYDGLCPLP